MRFYKKRWIFTGSLAITDIRKAALNLESSLKKQNKICASLDFDCLAWRKCGEQSSLAVMDELDLAFGFA